MDWLKYLGDAYDEYIAPTVNKISTAASDAGSWLNETASSVGKGVSDFASGLSIPGAPAAPSPTGNDYSNWWSSAGLGDYSAPSAAAAPAATASAGLNVPFTGTGGQGDGGWSFSPGAAATPTAGVTGSSGYTPGAMGGDYAGAQYTAAPAASGFDGLMGKAKGGLDELENFGKKYGNVIQAGTKVYGALKASDAGDKRLSDLKAMQAGQAGVEARNNAVVDKKAAMGDRLYADASSNVVGAGQRAYANTLQRGASAVNDPNSSAAARRRAGLQTTLAAGQNYTVADQAARGQVPGATQTAAGLMGSYTAPSNQYSDAASRQEYVNESQVGALGTMANDIFGLGKKKAKDELGTAEEKP